MGDNKKKSFHINLGTGRNKQVKQGKKRTQKKTGFFNSGLLGNNRFRALLAGLLAVIIIVFVVLGAVGAFDSEAQRAEKAAKREAAAAATREQTTEAETETEETTTEEPETETQVIDPDARTVYLTFEGGPSEVTGDIVDILNSNGVKGTFFIVSEGADASALKKISDGGHSIGVYSASENPDEIYADAESFKNDVNTCRQYIFQQTGVLSDVYRFPGGSVNASQWLAIDECKSVLDELGLVYYDWNIESGDDMDDTVDAQTIADSIMNGINSNEFRTNVVLFHDSDSKTTTADALEIIIPQLKSDGFEFAKLTHDTPEMTFDIE